MSGAKSCGTNWEWLGPRLGSVWLRTPGPQKAPGTPFSGLSSPVFVAVKPDGSVLGVDYPTRSAAIVALARATEWVQKPPAGVVRLAEYRARASAPRGFAQGLVAMLQLSARQGN